MTRVCSKQIRCRHKGQPISLDKFRQGDTKPHCYITEPLVLKLPKPTYALPPHFSPPSPETAQREECRQCKRRWSLPRFVDSIGRQRATLLFFDREVRSLTKRNLREIMVNVFEMLANSEESMQSLISNHNGSTFSILLLLIHQTLMGLHYRHVVPCLEDELTDILQFV